MSVTIEDVQAVASLARLQFTDEEQEVLTGELNAILRFVGCLNELNTDMVEPTSHVLPVVNAFREDEISVFSAPTEMARNASDSNGSHYKVPRIID